MERPLVDYEVTRALLEACFRRGVVRVIIETRSQHVYALTKKKRSGMSGPPLWDAIREMDRKFKHKKNIRAYAAWGQNSPPMSFMGCGNGGMKRGDQAQWQDQYGVRLVPGVYFSVDDLPEYDPDAFLAKFVEHKLKTGKELKEPPPTCPHGGRENCKENCFDGWEIWP